MIVLLRGHVRDAFQNDLLYNELKALSHRNLKIFIHTWNIVQSNISWRKLPKNEYEVTEPFIREYFRDLNEFIYGIEIDDDEQIVLLGNTEGTISYTGCPVLGWKRMWYGKKRVLDMMLPYAEEKEEIVNMRFDVFSNLYCSMSPRFLRQFLNQPLMTRKIQFAFSKEMTGIDNVYKGYFSAMYHFVNHFYFHFDSIVRKHVVKSQEFIVFRENELMHS